MPKLGIWGIVKGTVLAASGTGVLVGRCPVVLGSNPTVPKTMKRLSFFVLRWVPLSL